MNDLLLDLRYALRSFRHRPGFTLVAVITLALGIGANSAIWSAVHGVLLTPLPYSDPERLAMVWEDHRAKGGPEQEWTSEATFQDWRRGNRSFAALTTFTGWQPNLTGQGEPERLEGAAVSSEYFAVLGVQPARGRAFLPAEGRPGAPRVVVITDGLWHRRFAADSGLVGRRIRLAGEAWTVVGILPPGFTPPFFDPQVFQPLEIPDSPGDRGNYYLRTFGRLKPGVTLEAAAADLDRVTAGIAQESPEYYRGVRTRLVPLQRQIVGTTRTPLLVLLAAVGLVLLIACANVANLLLARASARGREIAVRTALGAGRGRLVRQLLTESLLLAAAGGVLGLLAGLWGVELLRALAPPGTPRIEQIGASVPVLAFTLAVALATGLVFGLAPALQASWPGLDRALKEGGRGAGAGVSSGRLRAALVMGEVALSLALLAGAGLLLRSFVGMLRTDLGFDPRALLVADLALPETDYAGDARVGAFFSDLTARLESVPGVEAAAAVSVLPLGSGDNDVSFVVEGRTPPAKGQEPSVWYRSATPDYFRTLGMPVVRGRGFDRRDGAGAPPVAVINQTMARRFFPGEDPAGQRLRLGSVDSRTSWMTILGIVADVRHDGPAAPPKAEIFFPLAQQPARSVTLLVRGADPLRLAPTVRAQVGALDRNLPLAAVSTLDHVLSTQVATPRLTTALLGVFAALALLLAAVGIYGVTSHAMVQRLHEIGVRIALGAGRRDVLYHVVGRGMAPALAGVALGLALAFALTRALAGLLVGVSPFDPATFAGVALLLAGVALLANYLPARRAARLDPVQVLKGE